MRKPSKVLKKEHGIIQEKIEEFNLKKTHTHNLANNPKAKDIFK